MSMTRRSFGALAAAGLYGKPDSRFKGVQIGVITYSFRALNANAEETLKHCLDCGISAIELMSDVAENFAGAPRIARGPGPGPRMNGKQVTPEQREARRKAAEDLTKWRLSVPMAKYKEFRRLYNDAGVKIYAFKLPPTMEMTEPEYDYIWNVAETVGANHITMELPNNDELLQRTAGFAARRKLPIAFHTHGQGGASGFDKALNASPYTMLNLDVGHYVGVNGQSPVPVIEKYHARISSLHLKDRKGPREGMGGPNVPWGQGDTPLKEILQLMRRNKYKFPGSIEYEYNTPEGSTVIAEIKKCVDYCRSVLA